MDDRPIRSLFQREPGKELPPGIEPAEADLSAEDQEKIRLARDLLAILVKTYKAYRIYLANNDLLQRFRQELCQKFQEFLNRYDALELRIRQSSMTLMGQPVYRSQDEGDNLAHQLFRDGMRRLTFNAGLPEDEIMGFLEILKKNAEGTQENDFDIVTLFWEKDFKYVAYHAVEELLPEGVDISEFEALADEHIEKITTLNFYTEENSPFIDSAFGFSDGEKRQDVYDNVIPSEETITKSNLAATFHALDSDEIKKILNQVKGEKIEELFLDMADTILEAIYTERTFEDFKMLIEFLEQILHMFINSHDLKNATEILQRLHFLADGYRKTSGKAAEFIDQIILSAGTEKNLTVIFSAIGQGAVVQPAILGNFLAHLGAAAMPHICHVLRETNDNDLRKNLCDVLVLLGQKHFDALMESLDEKTDRNIRNKIYILTRIGDERSLIYFRKLVQHPNPSIRQLVIQSFSRFYNAVTREILFSILNDQDSAVRISTLKCLSQTRDPKALEEILSLVSRAHFHEKELNEKRVIFSSMATLGGNGLCESLGTILSRQNLKDKAKDDEVRICAAEALGIIGTEDALQNLQKGLKSKRKAVIKVCSEQMENVRGRLGIT